MKNSLFLKEKLEITIFFSRECILPVQKKTLLIKSAQPMNEQYTQKISIFTAAPNP